MQEQLSEEKEIVIQSEVKQKIKTLTLMQVMDFPVHKIVRVRVREINRKPFIVWGPENYPGDFTKEDILKRVKEIFNL